MKLLFLPRVDRPIQDKEAGLLEAGFKAMTHIPQPSERAAVSQRFVDMLKTSDIVLVEYARAISPTKPGCYQSWQWVRQNYPGKPIIMWCEEIRMAPDYPPFFKRIVRHFNYLLLNHADQTTQQGYRNLGFTGTFGTMYGSGELKLADSLGEVPIEYEAVFAGNLYISRSKVTKGPAFPLSSARHALLGELDKHVKLGIAGKHWSGFKHSVGRINDQRSLYRFLKSGKIILGYNQFNLDGYYPERFWQSLCCGRAHLVRKIPNIEKSFQVGTHLLTFDTAQDALGKIKQLLANDAWKKVGAAGRHVFMNHHRWAHRFKQVHQIAAKLCPTASAS